MKDLLKPKVGNDNGNLGVLGTQSTPPWCGSHSHPGSAAPQRQCAHSYSTSHLSHLSAKTRSRNPDYFVPFLPARKHKHFWPKTKPPSPAESQATKLQDWTYFWCCDCCIFGCAVAHLQAGAQRVVPPGYPLADESSSLCPLRVLRVPKSCFLCHQVITVKP